jgi:hypothetical protein
MSGWNDDGPPLEDVARLGADRLAALVVDHALHDAGLAQALRLALATSGSDQELVEVFAGELDAIEANRPHYDDGSGQDLARSIDRIRTAVSRDLVSRAPRAAANLLRRLMRLHASITAQVRDRDGVIGSAIEDAITDFGHACAALPDNDRRRLPGEIAALVLEDNYGARRRLFPSCREALGPDGLAELEGLFRQGLDKAGNTSSPDRYQACLQGLAEVADARGDVDSFIEVQHLAGTEERAVMDIANRLVGAGRLDEALQRLEHAAGGEQRHYDLADLRIEVLDRLGRGDEAQQVRWGMFLRTLSAATLEGYLSRLLQEARPRVTAAAVAAAERHRDVHAALALLADIAPDAAVKLVCHRLAEFSGDAAFSLRPAAERLALAHPLAAALLHRLMADAVLARARSASYAGAVQNLVMAEAAAARVQDWQGFPTQDEYRLAVARQHRAKAAFWTRMQDAGLRWRQ